MKKIIILMLIIVGFASCTKNVSRQESEVFVIENVTVSPTTITFKFRGVNKPRTYAIAACQDGEGSTVYKIENAVKVEKDQICSISTISTAKVIVLLVISAVIIFIIGIFLWFAVKDMFFT